MSGLPIYIVDHAAAILDEDVYAKIKDLPRWQAWAEGIGGGTQLLEDTNWALLVDSLFDNARGDQLDQWGSVVGEQRGGLNDEEYRRFIQARILTNRCGGTGDEYIEIWRLVTGPNQGVRAIPLYPACFSLTTFRDEPMRDEVVRRVVRMMEDAKADGIGMDLTEAVLEHFGFEGDPLAQGFNKGLLARSLR